MLDHGINVAIGTDSAASAGDLNLVEELRRVHRERPELAVETLWAMVTVNAAAALGCDHAGRLSLGAAADLCVFDAASDAPLREILESDVVPREVWLAGVRVDRAPPHAAAP
jgi:cytosine/adenosine deaminase-related metal-dependent hydrolase